MYESIISNNSEYFFQSSIWMDIIRSLFWIIIKFLVVLSNAMENVFNSAYELINFLDTDTFKNFITRFSVFIIPILTVSFLAIGLILTFSEKKPPVLKNIAIGLAIIYVMPTIISYLNIGLISAKNDLLDNSMTNQMVLSNISDLSYIATQGFSFSTTLADTSSNQDMSINAIDVTEHLNPKKYNGQAKEIFSHYMTIDETGHLEWKEYDKKGMFDIFDPPWYYRYSVHFFQLFLYLLANILVFGFSTYAVVRMIFEIVTSRILACLHSMELASGEKTKKILEYFFQAYLILLFIPIMLKVYLLIIAYTNTNFDNGLIRAIIVFLAALIIVDGPSIIQKIYGYDLGMSQGAQKVMSFMRLVQQQRMQHHMMQNSKNARKNRNFNNASRKSGSAANEPNINLSSMNNKGQQFSNVSEPNINSSSATDNTAAFSSKSNGKNGNTNNTKNNADNINSNSSINNSGGGAMNEPNINNMEDTNKVSEPNINKPTGNTKEPVVNNKEDKSSAGTAGHSPAASGDSKGIGNTKEPVVNNKEDKSSAGTAGHSPAASGNKEAGNTKEPVVNNKEDKSSAGTAGHSPAASGNKEAGNTKEPVVNNKEDKSSAGTAGHSPAASGDSKGTGNTKEPVVNNKEGKSSAGTAGHVTTASGGNKGTGNTKEPVVNNKEGKSSAGTAGHVTTASGGNKGTGSTKEPVVNNKEDKSSAGTVGTTGHSPAASVDNMEVSDNKKIQPGRTANQNFNSGLQKNSLSDEDRMVNKKFRIGGNEDE